MFCMFASHLRNRVQSDHPGRNSQTLLEAATLPQDRESSVATPANGFSLLNKLDGTIPP
jgi:hypothetical protein